MKNFLRVFTVAVVFCLGLTALVPASTGASTGQGRVLGGYKDCPTDDEEVLAAANAAVTQQSAQTDQTITLVSVDKARRQVVAGTNYDLCLTVEIEGESTSVSVQVFTSLQRERTLKGWAVKDCQN